jgi:hypothetical protein
LVGEEALSLRNNKSETNDVSLDKFPIIVQVLKGQTRKIASHEDIAQENYYRFMVAILDSGG